MQFEIPMPLLKKYEEDGFVEIEYLFDEKTLKEIETLFEKKSEHDISRKESKWKKIFFGSGPSQVASGFSKEQVLQIGFDHLYQVGELPEAFTLELRNASKGDVAEWREESLVPAISSIAPIACGMLITQSGRVLFIEPMTEIEAPEEACIICAWGIPTSRYIENRSDKTGPILMREGYSFGDILKPNTHSFVKK